MVQASLFTATRKYTSNYDPIILQCTIIIGDQEKGNMRKKNNNELVT